MTTASDVGIFNTTYLIEQVGLWAEKNYGTVEQGRRIPHYGLVEELGEATHCILKHTQKIRGYEDVDFFRKELKDAFADIIIYLCDYCSIHSAYFKFGSKIDAEASAHWLKTRTNNEELMLSRVTQIISGIMNYEAARIEGEEMTGQIATYCSMAQQLYSSIETWAACYDFDLPDIVSKTWRDLVSKRDWKKDSIKGGE